MTHHFGVLIPSTNTTVEAKLARLPAGYQAHFARLLTSTLEEHKLDWTLYERFAQIASKASNAPAT